MRLDTVETQSSQSHERQSQPSEAEQSLMTPARRAALEALEREFRDLLNARPQP